MTDQIKPRNPVARSPLLRKGGVHERARSGIRQNDRVSLSLSLVDWEDELAFERELQEGADRKQDDA